MDVTRPYKFMGFGPSQAFFPIPGDLPEGPDPICGAQQTQIKTKNTMIQKWIQNVESSTLKNEPEDKNMIQIWDPCLTPAFWGSCGSFLEYGPFWGSDPSQALVLRGPVAASQPTAKPDFGSPDGPLLPGIPLIEVGGEASHIISWVSRTGGRRPLGPKK